MGLFKLQHFTNPLMLIAISCLFFIKSYSQESLTKEQINRLADAGKIYGYIKYFHPYMQYKDINWDSVFVSGVEGIIQAKNKDDYAAVMHHMLSALDDNLTTIISSNTGDEPYVMQPSTYILKDSIGYINVNDVNDNTYGIIQRAYENISNENGLIFDMRKPHNTKFIYSQSPGTIVDWTIMFPDHPLFLFNGEALVPSLRTVYHKGNYETSFKQNSFLKLKGQALRNIPIVFIVQDEEQVPLSAIALQQAGRAAIIAEDGRKIVLGKASSFYLQDSLIVKIRVAEALNADGSLSVVHPNAVYAASDNRNSAIELARNMILNGYGSRRASIDAAHQAVTHLQDHQRESDFPSMGERMLAAAKIFAEIDNFHPAKDLMDKPWEESYRAAIEKFINAQDSLDYLRAVAELYSNIGDSHGFITNGSFSLKLNPVIQYRGNFIPPVITNVVENKVVVTGIYNDSVCKKIGVRKGDVIMSIDGKDPLKMIDEVRKYQPASTKASQTFFISKFLLFGEKGQIRKLKVEGRDQKIRNVDMPTLREYNGDFYSDDYSLNIYSQHVQPTFKLLSKDIGYADITSLLRNEDIDSMFVQFKNTKAIIFDDRGHPHCWIDGGAISKHSNAVVAKYITNVAASPNIDEIGALQSNFKQTASVDQSDFKNWPNTNSNAVYSGKIVMLINEAPQSAGEDLALKWKISSDAVLIGSPTSGTNGGMTSFAIPGNLTLWYTQEIASYPDGKRTQRLGVQPDIFVYPTIKGTQAGKDEVLERAVRYLQTGR